MYIRLPHSRSTSNRFVALARQMHSHVIRLCTFHLCISVVRLACFRLATSGATILSREMHLWRDKSSEQIDLRSEYPCNQCDEQQFETVRQVASLDSIFSVNIYLSSFSFPLSCSPSLPLSLPPSLPPSLPHFVRRINE